MGGKVRAAPVASVHGEMVVSLLLTRECLLNVAFKHIQCFFSKCIYVGLGGLYLVPIAFFYSTVNPSTYLQQGEYSLLYSRLGQLPPPVQIFCLHTVKGERVSATAVCLAEACLVVV